jgi:hypothetical protein
VKRGSRLAMIILTIQVGLSTEKGKRAGRYMRCSLMARSIRPSTGALEEEKKTKRGMR